MEREVIIQKIQELAQKHGRAPGQPVFEKETGIKQNVWGKYFVKWGVALEAAGFSANKMQEAIANEVLLRRFAELADELGHLPVDNEILAKRNCDPTFPSCTTFRRRGKRNEFIRELANHCRENRIFVDVVRMCEAKLGSLEKAVNSDSRPDSKNTSTTSSVGNEIAIPERYIDHVRRSSNQNHEEKRRLVVEFFVEILKYDRKQVQIERDKQDVRVRDRRDRPWMVVEVKPKLETDCQKKAARRQAFDYAHRDGALFVVLTEGDYYECYNRNPERCTVLKYSDMRMGNFQISTIRQRDQDLIRELAAKR